MEGADSEMLSGAGMVAVRNRTTMGERLQQRKRALESELADVNSAIASLEAHPEAAQVIEALSRLQLGLR